MANPRLQAMFTDFYRQEISDDSFLDLLRFAHDEGRLAEFLKGMGLRLVQLEPEHQSIAPRALDHRHQQSEF